MYACLPGGTEQGASGPIGMRSHESGPKGPPPPELLRGFHSKLSVPTVYRPSEHASYPATGGRARPRQCE
eukprot:11167976-Alexandrium_andersonii.AAC.1